MDLKTFKHDTARATATITQTVELLRKPNCLDAKGFLDVIETRVNELQEMLDDSYAELKKKDEYKEGCEMALKYFELNHLSSSIMATALRGTLKK